MKQTKKNRTPKTRNPLSDLSPDQKTIQFVADVMSRRYMARFPHDRGDDIEDINGICWVICLEAVPKYYRLPENNRPKLATYLFTTVKNRLINRRRDKKWRQSPPSNKTCKACGKNCVSGSNPIRCDKDSSDSPDVNKECPIYQRHLALNASKYNISQPHNTIVYNERDDESLPHQDFSHPTPDGNVRYKELSHLLLSRISDTNRLPLLKVIDSVSYEKKVPLTITKQKMAALREEVAAILEENDIL